MSNFFDSGLFFIIISILIILFLVWNIFLQIQIQKTGKKLKVLFQGKKAKDLEKVIFELVERVQKNETAISETEKFEKYLEKMAVASIQKIGIVRYNPFKEAGGDQSFSIALLDSEDNGFVITSLFGRETNRIYGKPIKKGKSEYQLSGEEVKAIEEATK